jgi:hypothetical protein
VSQRAAPSFLMWGCKKTISAAGDGSELLRD